ncbi:hypothetical protein [Anaerocolumna chitinilytica]|uniref:Uncharacterized protein n=1 Tax=Anaerocolumna chitinilytica TaxID=1727145 RepID=A0A7I8DQC8_9FIRM|nr:hypothetical protein [Anaerocolumna chitinilytica]BCK00590.1 hypothetical protein bsdcttw_36300 [Anaerocolumna chitinilytica]
MYFDHSKRSYYRFPNQNSVTDFDSQEPMYFPDKHSELYNQYSDLYLDSNGYQREDLQDRYS